MLSTSGRLISPLLTGSGLVEGSVPLQLDRATASTAEWDAADGTFLYRRAGVARYRITATSITAEREPGVADNDVAWVAATVPLCMLLLLRGVFTLHASVVEIDDRTVLLGGRSGSGKSTLTAALVQRGHRLISDEMAPVTAEDSDIRVRPGGRRLIGLWPEAIERLGLSPDAGTLLRTTLTKRGFPVTTADVDPGGATVGALLSVVAADGDGGGAVRLRGYRKVELVLQTMYGRDLVAPAGLAGPHREWVERLTTHMPMFVLQRDRAAWDLPRLCDAVEEAVTTL